MSTIRPPNTCGTRYAWPSQKGLAPIMSSPATNFTLQVMQMTYGQRSIVYAGKSYCHIYSTMQESRNLGRRFLSYVLNTADVDDFLSAVEIGCGLTAVNDEFCGTEERGAQQKGSDAIQEINQRFEQHAIGYRFENRHIIRVDSKLTHAEVIEPRNMSRVQSS